MKSTKSNIQVLKQLLSQRAKFMYNLYFFYLESTVSEWKYNTNYGVCYIFWIRNKQVKSVGLTRINNLLFNFYEDGGHWIKHTVTHAHVFLWSFGTTLNSTIANRCIKTQYKWYLASSFLLLTIFSFKFSYPFQIITIICIWIKLFKTLKIPLFL